MPRFPNPPNKSPGKSALVILSGPGPGPRSIESRNAPQAAPADDDQPDGTEGSQDDKPWAYWLGYHGEKDVCENCEYMEADGSCPIVRQQVDRGGHCEAFEAKEDQGAPDAGMQGQEAS